MDYMQQYQNWLSDPAIDDATKAELKAIENDPKEIEDRFYKELDFGTGGLRGVLGAGTNRLNIYTIRKATQGLSNYILAHGGDSPCVAIAHDSRNMSPEFSTEAALVLSANGIKTYTFDSLRPTPFLSFAVRHLSCTAGIVITASHNPPEYNGYKVYWSDGGQCPFPRDEEIIAEVNNVEIVKTMPLAKAKQDGLFTVAARAVDEAFYANVLQFNRDNANKSDLKIVFTPLHGAGNVPVQHVLSQAGFTNVYVVKEQEKPDGNFPTVAYPNPEDVAAFAMAIDLAREKDADIAVATDPDCDRVGVAVKHNGEYTLLNGNMTGAILAEFLISQNNLPSNGTIISTIVSTKMAAAIAKANGLKYMEVLTGFKYIGEKIKEFETDENHNYVFGFEESFGYLAGTYARDKDAVGATLLICEAAAYYKTMGLTLWDVLQNLYKKYGFFLEATESITLKGVEGVENIKKIMANLRQNPPTVINGEKVAESRDYLRGVEDLPVSDVLYYTLADGSWVCVRPSGTEPKIKIYMGVELASTATQAQAEEKLASLTRDMLKHIS